ncbi:hypothetical protein [Runella slithyformis]|uniref:DUF2975 domain-containing protein n=1 Tax=Runella slithyformis (strain ATCC 29530 / DSM 19594 / LMG 11500 / NCIMB 11436 / LSU 4) TaxID=761193 RepID=A0A7U3ZNB6_RUNSL|nr:hypothetical protein [Runella slithyformis]AEI50380.1 hypothetical protein Runsl_4027 [Runella slithyformis DSM 19594]
MKVQKIIFWGIMVFITIDFLSYFFPALKAIEQGGSGAGVWLFKLVRIAVCFGIGISFFWLQKAYSKDGFLTTNALKTLKTIGYLGLSIAVISSIEDAFTVLRSLEVHFNGHTPADVSWFAFVRAFIAHLLAREPLPILFGLFVLLIADFAKKALAFKSENESFI